MKISEVNDSLEIIELPANQKRSILQLIDVKITNDMKEVIGEIRQLEGKILVLENKVQTVHDKLSNEIKIVYWVIGIAMTLMLFVVAKK